MTTRKEVPWAGQTDRQRGTAGTARPPAARGSAGGLAAALAPAPGWAQAAAACLPPCGQPCATPGKSCARLSAPHQPWHGLLAKALSKQLLVLRSGGEHPPSGSGAPGAGLSQPGRNNSEATTSMRLVAHQVQLPTSLWQ